MIKAIYRANASSSPDDQERGIIQDPEIAL